MSVGKNHRKCKNIEKRSLYCGVIIEYHKNTLNFVYVEYNNILPLTLSKAS